ncbi:hypothetical protein ACP70R_044818 [Stipagrostis hirtigluma subsp. patula]
MRRLLSSAEHLAAVAAAAATPPPASAGVHTDTFLIIAAVLCFLLCVVGLAFVARCSRLCNPSAYSVDAAAAMPARGKGLERKALQALPTVAFVGAGGGGEGSTPEEEGEERPECAICLAEFARGDAVRVLPSCGHAFHAACVDAWLLSSSTCPSCRRALVVAPPPAAAPPPCRATAAAQASTEAEPDSAGGGERRCPCRTSLP